MFDRSIISRFEAWAQRKHRKPLVLRGARQVGKTTAVNLFARNFGQYIYLNLEHPEDRNIFERDYSLDELVAAIFFYKDKERNKGKTLLFIDEIQASPAAVANLRYFYEQAKDLHVIAAGSLLESLIETHINYPVGRVEYLAMKPLTFEEYLNAIGEKQMVDILDTIPLPDYARDKMLKEFRIYTLIGGMPEVVQIYSETRDIHALKPVFESLIVSYLDDVEKYARNSTMARVIRHTISSSFYEAGSRIKFQGFGNSSYKSREIGEALKVLEKAMLLYIIYPSNSVDLPIQPNKRKSPKLQLVDTGMVNYFAGLQKKLFGMSDINSVYQGKIAEHIVGQELLAGFESQLRSLHFWIKEDRRSSAEVDFLIPFENMVIPVEVKSGAAGRLRSLHQFIDRASHNYAVRIYSGELKVDRAKTIKGKPYFLLNLPFYLTGRIEEYIRWFLEKTA